MNAIKNGSPTFLDAWKPVPGVCHIEASDSGKIRTLIDRRRSNQVLPKPRELKASDDGNGYRIVCIRGDGGAKKTYRVCRLVLMAFVGIPKSGMQACHGNNIKNDDRIDNLRWGTASENTLDQVRHGVHRGLKSRGEDHPMSKLRLNQVIEIKKLIQDGATLKNIAERFNVAMTTVSKIKIGMSWKSADAMLEARGQS